jgi:hypothetical protein
VIADGGAGIAESGMGEPQITEAASLAPAVADLARDRQRLLVPVDGGTGIAEIGKGESSGAGE